MTRTPNLVQEPELRALGFHPLHLRWLERRHEHHGIGTCRDFDVEGDVPTAGGLYLFARRNDDEIDIRYVGMTTHLWMVTKGRLPSGAARGGQRYGRPKHAGVTRARINAALTTAADRGEVVTPWVRPTAGTASAAQLREQEEIAIQRWQTRRYGLNRG